MSIRPIHVIKKVPVIGRPVHNTKVLIKLNKKETSAKRMVH